MGIPFAPSPLSRNVSRFDRRVIEAASTVPEVELTTRGRRSGRPLPVTVWVSTDGERIFIRSGGGLGRHWPQNLLTHGKATLRLGELAVEVTPRHVTDPEEARAVSHLVRGKYGAAVKPSQPGQPPTPGEQATFELLPTSPVRS